MVSERVTAAIQDLWDALREYYRGREGNPDAARAALIAAIGAECEAAELREFQHHCVHLWDEAGLCIHCGASKP